MKNDTRQRMVLLLALLAAAGMVSGTLASPVLQAKPPKPLADSVCWLSPGCAVPRGGDADVMVIYQPDGRVLTQIFAFGHEEGGHLYYFDPKLVPVDQAQFGHYTALLASDGQWDEAFGIFKLQGSGTNDKKFVLGFTSDPGIAASQAGLPGEAMVEVADIANPVPLTDGPGDHLSVPYDATPFLSPAWRQAGYRAEFRTAVPEPGTLALMGTGLAGVMVAQHHKEQAEAAPPDAAAVAQPRA